MSAIDVRALSRLHSTQAVLHDVTFAVAAGSFVTVSGRSGSGKSTLLKLLSGNLMPSGGRIRLFNDLDLRTKRLRATSLIGYVDQLASPCTTMRMADLFDVAGRARHLLPGHNDAAVRLAVEHWDLASHLGTRCDRLASPEQVRFSLALALLHNPSLLLLDEPLTPLAAHDADYVLSRLRALPGSPTIVLAVGERTAIPACDRLLTLEAGRLVFDGRPDAGIQPLRKRA